MLAGAVFYLGALSVKDGHVPAKAIPFAGPFVPLILGTQLNWYVALASVMAVVGGCAALARKRTLPRLAGAMVGTGSWIGIGIVQLYRWL